MIKENSWRRSVAGKLELAEEECVGVGLTLPCSNGDGKLSPYTQVKEGGIPTKMVGTYAPPDEIRRSEMRNLLGNLRYALRQFRHSPVFTAAAVLTLALGIGGTTAIFTLVHAVMLRSLPVSDPGRLYRIGEGDDCCVEGGPQDRWGFYSYALYERLKANVPEFEEVAAFQAGNWLLSVRRQGETAGRPVRPPRR